MNVGGILALLAAPLIALAQGSAVPNSDFVAQVRAVSDSEVQAFLKNDPKTLAQLWSDDFVVTNPLNRLATKQQVLDMINSGFLVITSYDRRIEYSHVYGDLVVLAGSETVKWGGRMPNAGRSEQLRFTAIWQKQNGHWVEVVRHANIVPPTAAPTA